MTDNFENDIQLKLLGQNSNNNETAPPRVNPQPMRHLLQISFLLGLTLLGDTEYVNKVSLRKKFIHKYKLINEDEFEWFNALAQKSPGVRTNKFLFLVCYYKNSLIAGVLAVFLFNIPNSIFLYLISQHTHLSHYLIINILLSGFRSATAAILIYSCQILENSWLQNILIGFSFAACSIFPSSFIFFIMYTIAVMIGIFSKIETKPLKVLPINIEKKYSFPAFILLVLILLGLWILNRVIDSLYLYIAEIITIMVSVTISKANAIFALLFGQLSLFNQLVHMDNNIQVIKQLFFDIMGITILLPGPLTNVTIYVTSYFFGWKGGLLSFFIITILSIIFICIYIKYGIILLRNNLYKKIYTSMNCMNKGFCLYMTFEILKNEPCEFGMVVYIMIIILVILNIYKLHRYIAIIIGGLLAVSRKFFIWYYRGTDPQNFICFIE